MESSVWRGNALRQHKSAPQRAHARALPVGATLIQGFLKRTRLPLPGGGTGMCWGQGIGAHTLGASGVPGGRVGAETVGLALRSCLQVPDGAGGRAFRACSQGGGGVGPASLGEPLLWAERPGPGPVPHDSPRSPGPGRVWMSIHGHLLIRRDFEVPGKKSSLISQ